jgi:hypothetical protein
VDSKTVKSGRNQPYGENSCPHREDIKMNREGEERAVWKGAKTVNRKQAVSKWERRARIEGENRLDKTEWDRRAKGLTLR